MTYAQSTDLLARFSAEEMAQRTDRRAPRLVTPDLLLIAAQGGDLSSFTDAQRERVVGALATITRALLDASNTIDGYVSARYTLPLAPVPPVLQRIACDLARYYLYDDQVTEAIKQRHDAAVKLLSDVSRGMVQLGADAATGQAPESTAGAELVSGGRVWDRNTSQGFL